MSARFRAAQTGLSGDDGPVEDQRVGEMDRALEQRILDLLAHRDLGKTICVSEAARAEYRGSDDGWRALMEPARDAARRLVARGDIVVTQGGKVVDPASAKGPIRLRRVP